MSFLKRIFYHSMRFRGELIFASIFSSVFMIFFGSFYSEDFIGDFVKILAQISMLTGASEAPTAWSVWMALMVGVMMYLLIAVTAINIGSRIIPTQDDDGSEFFMGSNPMNPRLFYVENILAGLLVIFVMMLPSYIITLIFTFANDATEVIPDITLAFFAFFIMSYFFISISSAVTASMFQRGLARGVGLGYVFFGFIIELFKDMPDFKDATKLSVNVYAGITSVFFGFDFDWEPMIVILGISLFFTAIGYWRVKYPHYVEKATSKERFSIVDATTGYFVRPNSFLGRRYPLVSEQLRKDKKAMFIMILVFIMYFPVLLGAFKAVPDIGELAATFNTPSTAMMIQGEILDASILGYGILKFYAMAWLWFGIYSLLVAASIPTREVRTNSQDIIYGTNVSPGKLMNHRVIAMLIEFTIILWLGFVLMTGVSYSFGQAFIDDFATIEIQFNYFFVTWIHYSAIFIAIVAVAMIPREVSKGRRNGIAFFAISLLLNWMAYASDSAEFLKYISIFNNYNPVDLLYGRETLITGILKSGLTLIASLGFYYIVRKKRYKDSSLY